MNPKLKKTAEPGRRLTAGNGNVFSDLGFAPAEAAILLADADQCIAEAQRLKREAAVAIATWIKEKKLSQVNASAILDVSRPRVSDLVNYKLARFSLDMLVSMLARAGKRVELVVH